ncbi:MAG: 2-hydroxyacyl-CoA dehydratase [Deltaproteobacteria bacterium]|nr:2-hydroxyacyl-CoA dehydratase [Deltaproteobacteria bacterium]
MRQHTNLGCDVTEVSRISKKDAMSRKEYLRNQKNSLGRHIFGVFPAYYPKEIVWSFNALPVEIWDPPLRISQAQAHLQPYICPVVKSGLEMVLRGDDGLLDGFIFPHTCDSMQNLASLVSDLIKPHKACHFFYHPKAPYRDASRGYYLSQLKALAASLEKQLGAFRIEALVDRVRQSRTITRLVNQLYQDRAKGRLRASAAQFYQTLRRGEFLWPEDYILELEALSAGNSGESDDRGLSVILSGVMPVPGAILNLLDNLQVRVGHDDLMISRRRFPVAQTELDDPFEQLTADYFLLPPCPTRGSSIAQRRDYLLKLVAEAEAGGVIFLMMKFCEPEWFDVPLLQEELKKRKIPSLIIDTEPGPELSGQAVTRVEAFIEMITR